MVLWPHQLVARLLQHERDNAVGEWLLGFEHHADVVIEAKEG